MVKLLDANSGDLFGEISDAELQILVDELEEEFIEDQDYAITPMLLIYFEERKMNPHLLNMLRQALGNRDEVLVRWARE